MATRSPIDPALPADGTSYPRFLASNRVFLGFGFLTAFASSFGQTYFIGVFSPQIREEFILSHTAWGTVYLVGTLSSAAVLPWSGKFIDRLPLQLYTPLVCGLLVLACTAMAGASGVLTLTLAIFLLRQSGQGLMSHVSLASMARYFSAERGRAIAIASLGFAAGEAVLPLLAVVAIGLLGWRGAYLGNVVLLMVLLVPAILWLLRGHQARHRAHLARLASAEHDDVSRQRSWSRGEMLRDQRFYLLLPGVLAPPLIVTALFFHHLSVADAKSWSHQWITAGYVVYAAGTVLIALVAGQLIDRLGAARLLPVMLLPMALGLVLLAGFDSRAVTWPYLALMGFTVGFGHTASSAIWAELYGVGHLGAIKSLASALGVFASALGPVIMGAMMDLGIRPDRVGLAFAAYALLASALLFVAVRRARDGRAD